MKTKPMHRGKGLKAKPVRRTDLERQTWVERIMLWLVLAAAALVPLIVYLKSIDLRGIMLTSWRGQTEHVDFFNWYKSAALIAILVLLVILHIYRWTSIRNTLEMPRRFLPFLIFGMFAVLSAISSTIPEVALGGFTDRYEGLWVLLCYLLLAYTAFVVARTEKATRMILTVTLASTLVVSAIGLFQFFGMDFYQTDFGKRLMLPQVYERFMDQLSFNFGKNIMYTTVYNPNYLGSYAALLMPIACAWTYAMAGSGHFLKTATAGVRMASGWTRHMWMLGPVFCFGLFILWLGSMSRAGLLGGGAAMLLLFLLQFKRIFKAPIQTTIIAATMIGAFFLLNGASGGLVVEEFRQTLPSQVQQQLGMVPVSEEGSAAIPAIDTGSAAGTETTAGSGSSEPITPVVGTVVPLVKEVLLRDNRFRFTTESETLEMVMAMEEGEATLRFFDAAGSALYFEEKADAIGMKFADSRYAAYHFNQGEDYLSLYWYQYQFYFTMGEGKLTYVPKPYTYLTEAGVAPHIGFEGHERFATNRGWLWSRTLPLLGKTIFTGYGPDTFAVFFPKDDIAWRINLYQAPNIVVDKPHNWYLQTAVNTGIISMLMLLWLLGGFLLDAARIRFGRPVRGMSPLFGDPVRKMDLEPVGEGAGTGTFKNEDARTLLLTGILCGVAGYAIAGVFNDSVVSVAPIFWVMLGTGISLLRNAERTGAGKKP